MKRLFVSVFCLAIFSAATNCAEAQVVSVSANNRNASFYITEAYTCMREVIESRQSEINRNADGTFKSDSLTASKFAESIDKEFVKQLTNRNIKIDLQTTDEKQIVLYIANVVYAGRYRIAESQKAFDRDSDGVLRTKEFKLLPAVFTKAWTIPFMKKTGVYIKQASRPKSDYLAGTPFNIADKWELYALEKINDPSYVKGTEFIEVNNGVVRISKPVYISNASCLQCHGTPIGEKGPTGIPKEGFVIDELKAGISVILTDRHPELIPLLTKETREVLKK